ncbi:ATP-grasp domain-containing protein [Stieleria varia]|uniref:ATP-grasp domain-containing protein n=1 Tax=Stieleria varia TaxID=2528005 RepID=UPI0018D214EC|nr:ATP-grasp domain-containing protein [Stieleria varia]
MPRTCAYLTMENPEGFFVYDQLTYEPLRNLGWKVVEVPWSRPVIPWSQFDAVVIRSPWDYQASPARFLDTLADIESAGTRLLNPLHICRWNLDKTYLRELQQKGVPIVPTQWFGQIDRAQLECLIDEHQETLPVVIKPTVGAGATGIYLVSSVDSQEFASALQHYCDRPAMVQSFLTTIQTVGEYSLFYFAGQFSHAIIKKPKSGDFRVQEEHGGLIESVTPTDALLRVAEQALAALDEVLLYARVDLVVLDDGSPAVIELELVEPSLYFPYDTKSATRFAMALDRMVDAAS